MFFDLAPLKNRIDSAGYRASGHLYPFSVMLAEMAARFAKRLIFTKTNPGRIENIAFFAVSKNPSWRALSGAHPLHQSCILPSQRLAIVTPCPGVLPLSWAKADSRPRFSQKSPVIAAAGFQDEVTFRVLLRDSNNDPRSAPCWTNRWLFLYTAGPPIRTATAPH